MRMMRLGMVACFILAPMLPALAQPSPMMRFFVTSSNPGQGADFGGLAGADAHCQRLAAAVGAGGRSWRAYLSTQAAEGRPAVHARERIGQGPWHNVAGVEIARSLDHLHDDPNITKATALTERGESVPGRGDPINNHDILTGSDAQGRAFPAGEDRTCRNWTSSTDGAAMAGHHDRIGLRDDAPSRSWNASHPTRGCSLPALRSSGGAGYLYCFAAN